MTLDRFYPIFDSATYVERLAPMGIRLVQLRLKNLTDSEIRHEIRHARAACLACGCQLVVNDHWRIAIDQGCDFVHLGQEDLDAADLEAIRRAGLKLGVSTHNEAELERALAVQPTYVALGPIYPTKLKQMKWAPQGLARITEWKRRLSGTPLAAIGGMSVELAVGAFAAGADIVAAVTDITLHPNPEARVAEWLAATRSQQ
jgi:thiamine-phosphate pyrophosphorylase